MHPLIFRSQARGPFGVELIGGSARLPRIRLLESKGCEEAVADGVVGGSGREAAFGTGLEHFGSSAAEGVFAVVRTEGVFQGADPLVGAVGGILLNALSA